MISIVLPTLDSAADLPRTLTALVPAAIDGFVREVIVADGGSRDATERIADAAGVEFIACPKGRGQQLMAGARRARFPWLLFLHADTVLEEGWMRHAAAFMEAVDTGARPPAAATFRFKLDDKGFAPRMLEALVRVRCWLLRLPYGDQGLLLPRALLEEVGGFRALPIMEDVDLVRRIGWRRMVLLDSAAVTSAERFRRDGYLKRIVRNQTCLALYSFGVPAERIARFYDPNGAPGTRA